MFRSLFTDNELSERERKNILILDVIRRNGPIAKTDISRITKFNIVTVSNYVEGFIKKEVVTEKGLDVSSGGRRPELVELNSKIGYAFGLDIGPIEMTAVVTDLGLNIITKEKKLRPQGTMEDVSQEAILLVQKVLKESQVEKEKLKGVGIGISGIVDRASSMVRKTDVEEGGSVGSFANLTGFIDKEVKVPYFVGNDATFAVLGEKMLSLRITDENVIYLYSDVGSGMIIHNEVYWGSNWAAGETHLRRDPDIEKKLAPWMSESGFFHSRGVDLGLPEQARRQIQGGRESMISKMVKDELANIKNETIFEAGFRDDELAVEIIQKAGMLLGIKVAYLINLINPQVVVIGGGIEKAGDILLNPLRRVVRDLAYEEAANTAKIIPSRCGEDSVALGAACLVAQEVFSEL